LITTLTHLAHHVNRRSGAPANARNSLQGRAARARSAFDYTWRRFRQGKASISAELAGIFERLGCGAQNWQNRMEKLRDGRLLGRFFATTRTRLREIA
jgi:hypothetical protein